MTTGRDLFETIGEAIGLSAYKAGSGEISISTAGGLAGIPGLFLVGDALFGRDIVQRFVPLAKIPSPAAREGASCGSGGATKRHRQIEDINSSQAP